METYDVVVIGGGAAGLSGALALARARRRVLVLDAGEPRNAPAAGVHNLLGQDGVSVAARRLLVTTGLVDELPDVPGLAERWGRDVLHCPYCQGHEIRGVVVVRGEVVRLEVAGDALVGVRLADGRLVARAALVAASQVSPRAALLDALGLALEDVVMGGVGVGRRVPADAGGASAVPGVRVAGNVSDPVAQVATAAAQGLWAGAQRNAELVAEDTALAVAALRAAA